MNDDFNKNLISKLNQKAKQHQHKPVVMKHVLQQIQHKPKARYGVWKLTSFAVAAAIMVMAVLPLSIHLTQDSKAQTAVNQKLSPQMLEDLEMVMVMGEDSHGS